ncbi:MAG: tRNA (adenosine(37)-N6)-threonylcarbamoyltransferase complex ATPase subunit type 1 TsaE [Planctomycetes bacterium]|nr:tRNA (adenosine(37)-N6)-threonylcarbamoyltransferase complex ATPase subunit type 1 TsaE [Planctomycetota bacterium]
MAAPGPVVVRSFETGSEDETRALAERLARLLPPLAVVALVGDLGSGKTAFAQGLARGLGLDPREVTSPSFVLHHVHPGRRTLHHLDAYRLPDAAAFAGLALEEQMDAEAVAVVEWADRVRAALPTPTVEVSLEVTGPASRRLRVEGPARVVEAL